MFVAKIAQHLAGRGLVDYRPDQEGGDCFIDRLPQDPAEVVAIYTAPGAPADSALAYDLPAFQVIVRGPGPDPRVPHGRAQAIYDELHGLGDHRLDDDTWVVLIRAAGPPERLGPDTNERHRYAIQFDAEIGTNTSVHRV